MADEFPDRERFMKWWLASGQFECKRNQIENARLAWTETLQKIADIIKEYENGLDNTDS